MWGQGGEPGHYVNPDVMAGLAIENERLHARVQALEAVCKCSGASTRYPNRL